MWDKAYWRRRSGVKHLSGRMGESIGEVRDEAPGKTSDGGVCERHSSGAFVGMQWEGWIQEDASGKDGENN